MTKKIFFDMDGTIADLYGEKNWLDRLLNEERGLFENLQVMHNKQELEKTFNELEKKGYELEIITWTPKNVTDRYINTVTREKINWVQKNFPMIKNIYCLAYGTPKQKAPITKAKEMILVDDNEEVLEKWKTKIQRQIIKADTNLLEKLQALI